MQSLTPLLFLWPLLSIAQHDLILRDEGTSKLSRVNGAQSQVVWQVDVPPGRDLQPIGRGRILLGTGTGYEERSLSTGAKEAEVTTFPGTLSARRLRNGNTMLVGLNWQNQQGIVLVELLPSAEIKRTIAFPGFGYVRLVRETITGTLLVTADAIVFEGDQNGRILWQAKVAGHEKPHAWQAVNLSDSEILVSSGYPSNLQIFSRKTGELVRTLNAPGEVNPHFFAGFQVLGNGNVVVTNWQGHGPGFGASGTQLLELDRTGKLVWSWKQDPSQFSSLQGVIVLDDLDIDALSVEDGNGVLKPAK